MFKSSLLVSMSALIASPALAQTGPSEIEEEEARQETVVVTGRAQELYRVDETVTGKLPTDPLSSSQIISVITADLISDQGARDAADLYRNISGVSTFSYAGVTARGFRQEEIFFDGLRGDPYVGFNVPQLFNVERVEFLKGPAGMLYGPGSPGGLFNYVTKKPSEEFFAEITAIAGTEARYGGAFEINGALPVDGAAGRLGVFYESRNLPRRNAASDTRIYDAGLSFELPFADLILQATRYEQDLEGNRLRGVPVDDLGNFLGDRRWNHNEDSDFLDLESTNLQARLEGDLTDEITWDATIRYTDSAQSQEYHEPIQLIDVEALLGAPTDGTPDLVARQFRDQLREEEQISFGANAIWSRSFGQVDNRLLVGYEYYDFEQNFFNGGLTPDLAMLQRFLAGASLPSDIIPLSITNPVYGVTQPELYNVGFLPLRTTTANQQGAYLLNEATLGRFTGVAGVRFDTFEDEINGAGFDDDNVSYRVGAIYKVRDDVSLFAQWADSYEPQNINSQIDGAGGPFDPTEGTILEAGIKTELMNGRIQTSAAIYEVIRENILQGDPDGDPEGDGVDNFIAFGEVTSQGFEFDIAADITDNWVITAAYGYNDTKITETTGTSRIGNSVGDRFANAPEHQFGFWTRYQIPAYDLALAFGGDYVDVRTSLSGQKVRPYTVFDASIIYSPGPYEFLLRVDNVFDEEYAASGFNARGGHFPGEPLSVFLEASRRF